MPLCYMIDGAMVNIIIKRYMENDIIIIELNALIKSYKKQIIECRSGKNFHSKNGGSMYGVYSGELRTLNKTVLTLNKILNKNEERSL